MEKFDIDQLYNRLLPRLETLEKERIALVEKLATLKKMGIAIGIVVAIGVDLFCRGFIRCASWRCPRAYLLYHFIPQVN